MLWLGGKIWEQRGKNTAVISALITFDFIFLTNFGVKNIQNFAGSILIPGPKNRGTSQNECKKTMTGVGHYPAPFMRLDHGLGPIGQRGLPVGTGREEGRAPGGVTARGPLGLQGAGGPGHGGDRPGGGAGGADSTKQRSGSVKKT